MLMTELKEWQEKLDLCGRCGNCQQVCPLYQEEKTEMAVARGKLHIISLLLEGKMTPTPGVRKLLDFCLQCGRCADVCQNGVPADKLIALGRSAVNKALGGGLKTKLIRQLLGKDKLKASIRTLEVMEKVGLKIALQGAGKVNTTCNDYSRLLPVVKGEPLLERLPKITPSHEGVDSPRVGYFVGCMNNFVSQDVGTSTMDILKKTGVTVIVPEQKCCGLPSWTSGELEVTEKLVAFNVQAFQDAGVDLIVTDCASCGHALKELPEIFMGMEGRVFQEKCLDLSEFIDKYVSTARLEERSQTVTYHDPCHLKFGQKIKDVPRKILYSMPGLNFKEMDDPGCCGFAGTFALSNFGMSNRIAEQRAAAVKRSGAEVIVTSCPACQLQLQRICVENGQEVKVLNLAQLIDPLLLG